MLIVNILALTNIFIIFILLFFRKENALPNKILAVAFLIPGLYLINTIFILAGFEKWIPVSLFFVQMIAVFFPVMVYYYFNLLLGKGFRAHKTLFIGSGVLLLYIIALAIRFYFLSKSEKSEYIFNLSTEDYPLDLFLYTVFFYVWQSVYFSVITLKIIKYKHRLEATFSNMDRVKFFFLVRFVFFLWFFNTLLVVLYILLPLYLVDYLLMPIVVNVLYFFLLYFSYHHNAVFTAVTFEKLNEVNDEINRNESVPGSDEKVFVPTDKHQSVYEALSILLDKEHIYCESDLSMKAISNRLGELDYVVSQSINYFYKKSFFDLINERRIEASKIRLLQMLPHETIEGIAYDTGFNSRSSFYRAFKKYTGETPQQFINTSK